MPPPPKKAPRSAPKRDEPPNLVVTHVSPYVSRPIERRLFYQVAGKRFGREAVRAGLALISLVLVAATVIMGWISSGGEHWDNAQQWLQAVLPAETAIVGSALGFYFGDKRQDPKDKDD